MINNKKRAAAEAGALRMALVLAAKTGWQFARGPITASQFAIPLYVDRAQLLLVPTTAGLPFAQRQLDLIIREARSDALIVSRPTDAAPVFALATWRAAGTCWTAPLVLWLAVDGVAWLVPPAGDGDQLAFELGNHLHHVTAPPWSSGDERGAGLRRARVWMLRVAGAVL